MTQDNEAELLALANERDARGHFAELVCVGAHDRCFGGAGGPCPYCERICRRCRAQAQGQSK